MNERRSVFSLIVVTINALANAILLGWLVKPQDFNELIIPWVIMMLFSWIQYSFVSKKETIVSCLTILFFILTLLLWDRVESHTIQLALPLIVNQSVIFASKVVGEK